MSLKTISKENLEQENDIQKKIFLSIDKNENIIFSSGAGAGKTYALITSLKYIINQYGESLKSHNQKVICITYTNVATEEVKERLGNSDLVKVSTIHERIWEIVKDYQSELVIIHQEKLDFEIKTIENELSIDNKFSVYQNLSIEEKASFKELMLTNKEHFYQNKDLKAAPFRRLFEPILTSYPDILKNFANFKALVKAIYRIEDYFYCLEQISNKEDGYCEIIYNAAYNIDHLHKMRISHDTLLEYGLKIIENHEVLQQIIVDKYPYILIDEYQDTDDQVIKILSLLSNCSERIEHNQFIGYFGDPAQNIYDGGVGSKITTIHSGLKEVSKRYNRRSFKEIIDVINLIRNDDIKQVSIFEDSNGGSVKFYNGDREKIDDFISSYVKEWKISKENKLHCFVLTNKTVAEYSGFSNIYSFFAKTSYYKRAYSQLNTELLSGDPSKLGEIPILLFRIIDFRYKLLNNSTQVNDLLGKSIYKDMDVIQLRGFIKLIKAIKGETLKDLIESIQNLYESNDNSKYKLFIRNLYSFDGFPAKSFVSYMKECLYPNLKEEEVEEVRTAIEEFLEINLNEFMLWYKYITRETEDMIVYHTYHGTKGREFNNVIVLMENAFGVKKNYFNKYFTNLINEEVSQDSIEKFEQKSNLLYVACSRAIKNLRVLYLDDVTSFRAGIEKIFSKVENYS